MITFKDNRGEQYICKKINNNEARIFKKRGDRYFALCGHNIPISYISKNLNQPCPQCSYYQGSIVISAPVKKVKYDEPTKDPVKRDPNLRPDDYLYKFNETFDELNRSWDYDLAQTAIQYLHFFLEDYILNQNEVVLFDPYRPTTSRKGVTNQRIVFPPVDKFGKQKYFVKISYIYKRSVGYEKYLDEMKKFQSEYKKINKLDVAPRSHLIMGLSSTQKQTEKKFLFFYQVLSYVEGKNLKETIEENPEDVSEILSSVFKGIEKLHSNNIVHGDLSPYNIIMEKSSNGFYIVNFFDFALTQERTSMTEEEVFGRINLKNINDKKSAKELRRVFIRPMHDYLTFFYNFFSTGVFDKVDDNATFMIFLYKYVLRVYNQKDTFQNREDTLIFERSNIVDMVIQDIFRSNFSRAKYDLLNVVQETSLEDTYGRETYISLLEDENIGGQKDVKEMTKKAFFEGGINKSDLLIHIETYVQLVWIN